MSVVKQGQLASLAPPSGWAVTASYLLTDVEHFNTLREPCPDSESHTQWGATPRPIINVACYLFNVLEFSAVVLFEHKHMAVTSVNI